ncbi:hypothetical protein GIB67_040722 [Kingdonia uniflora]|uniref:Transposase n=1 Tax=Kingdonia uniflora TaxID=39325 RepID=A0A7J7KUE4_9MAGN|nr:hypothetical protein GIB67_040722 [Kingdonia uniflora]
MSPTGWVDSDYKGEKSFKYRILCEDRIIYEEYVRDIAVKVNGHHEVGSYIPEGNVIEVMCLCNGLLFVVRCTDDLRNIDKEIDPEEINANEIETQVNIVPKSESECDDIDEEQKRWVRYAQVGIDCLGAEDGYYSTHSFDDEDYVPAAEDLERCNEFKNVDVELDDICSKEEDDKAQIPLTVGFKKLEVGMQWAIVYETREHMRRKLGADNTLCNAPWVAREVEALVRDVRAMTPKAIKTRMKTQYGVEISYWTTWNARQICMESIVGSYDQGYHDMPSLCVEILKSNPGSIARTWRQDDTLQWTGTLAAFKASLNGFVKGCKPILRLDGYFLKGRYGGVSLSVLSLDASNGLFPIGVYMYKTECKESWLDFLAKIEP